MTTDNARFSSSPFSRIVLLSVSQYHIAMALVQQKNKKYGLKFKCFVFVKYAEEKTFLCRAQESERLAKK